MAAKWGRDEEGGAAADASYAWGGRERCRGRVSPSASTWRYSQKGKEKCTDHQFEEVSVHLFPRWHYYGRPQPAPCDGEALPRHGRPRQQFRSIREVDDRVEDVERKAGRHGRG